MTQEEKQLLLKDLLSRQLYTPIVNIKGIKGYDRKLVSLHRSKTTSEFDVLVNSDKDEEYLPHTYSIDEIKPYLRSMDSMTDEEKVMYSNYQIIVRRLGLTFEHNIASTIEWLLERHFDYQGLIEKGLAIEAKEGIYN